MTNRQRLQAVFVLNVLLFLLACLLIYFLSLATVDVAPLFWVLSLSVFVVSFIGFSKIIDYEIVLLASDAGKTRSIVYELSFMGLFGRNLRDPEKNFTVYVQLSALAIILLCLVDAILIIYLPSLPAATWINAPYFILMLAGLLFALPPARKRLQRVEMKVRPKEQKSVDQLLKEGFGGNAPGLRG